MGSKKKKKVSDLFPPIYSLSLSLALPYTYFSGDEEEFEIVITSIQTDKILQEQQQQHHQQQQQRKQQQHQRQQAAARGRGRGRGGRGGSVGRGEEKKRKEGFLKGKQSKLRTKSKANLVQGLSDIFLSFIFSSALIIFFNHFLEEEIENTDPEVRYAMEQGTKVIKAITLPRLIDQLALVRLFS